MLLIHTFVFMFFGGLEAGSGKKCHIYLNKCPLWWPKKLISTQPQISTPPPQKKIYIIVNTQYEFTCRPVFFILCFVHDQCTYLKCVTENDENLSSPHPKVQKLITILFSPGGHWIMVAKLIQTSRHFTLLPDCKFKHQDNQALIWIQK